MAIYIELAFIENFCIDYLLLFLALKFSKAKTNKLRLVLATLIGTFFALITPLVILPEVVLFLLKILVGVAMCLIANQSQKLKENLIYITNFFIFTFILGGVLFAVVSFFEISYVDCQGSYVINSLPIVVTIVIVFLFVFMFDILIEIYAKRKTISNYIYECILFEDEKKVFAKGFLDTGNLLYTSMNEPMIIVNKSIAIRLFEKSINDYIKGKESSNMFFKETIKTINGESKISCFKLKKLLIYNEGVENIIENVVCGINFGQATRDYDLILHSDLF